MNILKDPECDFLAFFENIGEFRWLDKEVAMFIAKYWNIEENELVMKNAKYFLGLDTEFVEKYLNCSYKYKIRDEDFDIISHIKFCDFKLFIDNIQYIKWVDYDFINKLLIGCSDDNSESQWLLYKNTIKYYENYYDPYVINNMNREFKETLCKRKCWLMAWLADNSSKFTKKISKEAWQCCGIYKWKPTTTLLNMLEWVSKDDILLMVGSIDIHNDRNEIFNELLKYINQHPELEIRFKDIYERMDRRPRDLSIRVNFVKSFISTKEDLFKIFDYLIWRGNPCYKLFLECVKSSPEIDIKYDDIFYFVEKHEDFFYDIMRRVFQDFCWLKEKEEKEAEEAEERKKREAKEAEERKKREAKEAEERKKREAKEAEERRKREVKKAKEEKKERKIHLLNTIEWSYEQWIIEYIDWSDFDREILRNKLLFWKINWELFTK